MKSIIPYEHEIKFDTKIAEITSISLEHEDKINDEEIAGDFIVSGEYKVHSISVNRESFKYRLPFSIELSDKMIRDSIKYDITDFTYDIKNSDTLLVKIEVSLEADEIEEEIEGEKTSNEATTMPLPVMDNIKTIDDNINRDVEQIVNDKDDSTGNTENIIMENVGSTSNTYITYHVHLVKETDTLESICATYKVNKELINEYNNDLKLTPGLKLLIPEIKDE